MITLNLHGARTRNKSCHDVESHHQELQRVRIALNAALADLAVVVEAAMQSTLLIPTDFLHHAKLNLFPAERMAVVARRVLDGRLILGAACDVTGVAHHAHVRADPGKLAGALMAFERSGAQLGAWVHSHPGTGITATAPSQIDRDQYADWIRDFGDSLVAAIIVSDGFVRFWGDAVESGTCRVKLVGDGVRRVGGHRHVYRVL